LVFEPGISDAIDPRSPSVNLRVYITIATGC
jgi:hypothetical protein